MRRKVPARGVGGSECCSPSDRRYCSELTESPQRKRWTNSNSMYRVATSTKFVNGRLSTLPDVDYGAASRRVHSL